MTEVIDKSNSESSIKNDPSNTTFHTFFKKQDALVRLEKGETLASTIAASSGMSAFKLGLPKNVKKRQFHNLASNVANDEEFIKDFSDAIGDPRENETEDMFVTRASALMRVMLTSKFFKAKG